MKFALITIFLFLALGSLHAQTQDAEKFRELTTQSMVNNSDGIQMEIAWMIPDEFWEYVINSNPETAGTETAEEFYDILTEYTIIAVVVGSQSYGRFNFVSEEGLRNTMILYAQDGEKYEPLKTEEQSEELQFILDIFRPVFGQFLGELGANLHFFAFKKENSKGERTFDPVSDKDVTLDAGGTSFQWELPMSTLVPEKRCPEDKEMMNGTWNYCPIHGDELEVVEN